MIHDWFDSRIRFTTLTVAKMNPIDPVIRTALELNLLSRYWTEGKGQKCRSIVVQTDERRNEEEERYLVNADQLQIIVNRHEYVNCQQNGEQISEHVHKYLRSLFFPTNGS
jgi:hypothetical protein